ncbi:MAG: hypothetical protein V7K41_06260 [Nostoc sp.]|uniref:hypothetical protein n=1 Tax=Nostoc sp. TaxID=1180 RepID=UPI002FFA51FD
MSDVLRPALRAIVGCEGSAVRVTLWECYAVVYQSDFSRYLLNGAMSMTGYAYPKALFSGN